MRSAIERRNPDLRARCRNRPVREHRPVHEHRPFRELRPESTPRRNRWLYAFAATIAIVAFIGCGRTLSRFGLGSQKLKAPKGAMEVLSIAFHKQGKDTIKDVMFVMEDCSVVAREYKDISPFEGEVRFLTHNGEVFKQAGCKPKPKPVR